ncbi:MAG: tyrosine-type recombinase/integrase [Oscillospiraceae bacterium]|nr:tyrosine-type recombinase/integrase [Oscillospiraceae bacterium]
MYTGDAPPLLRQFLAYHETVKGHSRKTVDEYYLDLRLFFRFLKEHRGQAGAYERFDDIPINDVDIETVRSVTLQDVYAFMAFLSRQRPNRPNSEFSEYGLGAAARARKATTLRSFFKFLTLKARLLDVNPIQDLDVPKLSKTLPRYLKLDECLELLNSVEGRHQARDYCILTLFLNCGLRISELASLDLTSIKDDALRVKGKGDKERVVYLNEACLSAIADHLRLRGEPVPKDKNALFLSSRRSRISVKTIHVLVKKHLLSAGLDASRYSSHKLRHSAATLMLQNGVDVRTLQEILGHEHLNTTQIYTHVENSGLRDAARANPLADIKKTTSNT